MAAPAKNTIREESVLLEKKRYPLLSFPGMKQAWVCLRWVHKPLFLHENYSQFLKWPRLKVSEQKM